MAFKEYLPEATIKKEFDFKDKEKFLSDVGQNLKEKPDNKGIVIAAEVGCIDSLKALKDYPNVVIAHSSHQYTKDHESLKNVADVVALPTYVVTQDIIDSVSSPRTRLVQTAGVPHNLSPQDVEEAYRKNKEMLPDGSAYVAVILGGDAETPDKKLLYYTPGEAEQLAQYIAPQVQAKQTHLLILNGPRTGKHNPETGEVIPTSHRDGTIDAVSAAFVKALEQQGLASGKDFTFLDFQFGHPSASPVVLGVLRATGGTILVAGESTSMVSETADCLPIGSVTAFTNGAMNENHRKHCQSEYQAGRVSLLEAQGKRWILHEISATAHSQDTRPSSRIIADAIKARFDEKSKT